MHGYSSVHVELVIFSAVCARMCICHVSNMQSSISESTDIDCSVFRIFQPAEMKSFKFLDIISCCSKAIVDLFALLLIHNELL